MVSAIADFFAGIGTLAANSVSTMCVFFYLDEPKCPKSLIK